MYSYPNKIVNQRSLYLPPTQGGSVTAQWGKLAIWSEKARANCVDGRIKDKNHYKQKCWEKE